jgi:hypothetical protein
MTGHSLDVFVRHYADDYGKAHRDEARARQLASGFGQGNKRGARRKEPPATTS